MTAPSPFTGIIDAFTRQYRNDPKRANEVVTGACYWPPAEGVQWVYLQAVDLVDDYAAGVMLGVVSSLKLVQAIAARTVLEEIANQADQDRQSADRLAEDGPSVRL